VILTLRKTRDFLSHYHRHAFATACPHPPPNMAPPDPPNPPQTADNPRRNGRGDKERIPRSRSLNDVIPAGRASTSGSALRGPTNGDHPLPHSSSSTPKMAGEGGGLDSPGAFVPGTPLTLRHVGKEQLTLLTLNRVWEGAAALAREADLRLDDVIKNKGESEIVKRRTL
jgi:hypothetical protein